MVSAGEEGEALVRGFTAAGFPTTLSMGTSE